MWNSPYHKNVKSEHDNGLPELVKFKWWRAHLLEIDLHGKHEHVADSHSHGRSRHALLRILVFRSGSGDAHDADKRRDDNGSYGDNGDDNGELRDGNPSEFHFARVHESSLIREELTVREECRPDPEKRTEQREEDDVGGDALLDL